MKWSGKRMNRRVRIVVAALVVVLCLLGSLTTACASDELVSVEDVVGSWTSAYWEGRIDLELMVDGTYLQHFYGFDARNAALSDQEHMGRWSVSGDQVVLQRVLVVSDAGKNSLGRGYAVGGDWALDVVRGALGRISALEIEELVRFRRVGGNE